MLRLASIFGNIGGRIKSLAKTLLWVKFIVWLVVAIYFSISDTGFLSVGIIFFGGLLVSWVSSLLLYGFGQLIDNSTHMVEQNNQLLNALSSLMPNDEDEVDE